MACLFSEVILHRKRCIQYLIHPVVPHAPLDGYGRLEILLVYYDDIRIGYPGYVFESLDFTDLVAPLVVGMYCDVVLAEILLKDGLA